MPQPVSLRSQRIQTHEEDPVELMYARGVTDGLPVVPPTEERVKRMLAAVNRDPQELLGTVGPNYGRATIEKVAINAVMAGCKPEYFPVVLAAVSATSRAVVPASATVGPRFPRLGPWRRLLAVSGRRAGIVASPSRATNRQRRDVMDRESRYEVERAKWDAHAHHVADRELGPGDLVPEDRTFEKWAAGRAAPPLSPAPPGPRPGGPRCRHRTRAGPAGPGARTCARTRPPSR